MRLLTNMFVFVHGINIASCFVETITVSDPLQLLIEVFCLCSKVLRSSAVYVTLSFVLVSHLI